MPKMLKYIIIIFLSIMLLLFAIPSFIHLNSYKNVIVTKVKETTGRDLVINGDINFSILPSPVVSLQDVSLSSIPKTKSPFLITAKEAKISLRLFQLLTGNIEINDAELLNPVLNLEVTNQGKKNWEVTTTKNLNVTNKDLLPTTTTNDTEFKLPVIIKQLKISNGLISYTADNKQKILNDVNLNMKMDSNIGPIDLIMSFESMGHKINITGNIPKLGNVIPIKAIVDSAEIKVKLDGKFDTNNSSFVGEIISNGDSKNLNIPIDLHGNYSFTSSISADKKQIVLKNTKLDYKDIKLIADATHYDIAKNTIKATIMINPGNIALSLNSNINKSNIVLKAQSLDALLNTLNFKLNNSLPILNKKLALTTDLIYTKQEITLQNINFTSENSSLRGKVQVKNSGNDQVISHLLEINNINDFLKMFGINNANAFNIKYLQSSGKVQKNKNKIQLNNVVKIFDSEVSIKGDINLTNQKPDLNLTISSPLINLNKIITSSSSTTNITNNNQIVTSSTPWSNDPINLLFLNKINGKLSVNVDKLVQNSLTIDNLRVNLNITNGELDINSINANIYSGQLSASGHVSSKKEQNISFIADLSNVNLKKIPTININKKIQITDGQLTLKADLHSKGTSVYRYINNLNGKVNIVGKNCQISGFDLDKMIETITSIKDTRNILNVMNNSFLGGETTFKDLTIDTHIEDGIAQFDKATLDASSATVNATGKIDLPKYSMDINADVNITNLPPISINLYGLLHDPKYKVDFNALQTYLAKDAISKVVKNLNGGGKAKKKNLINDVLGTSKEDKNQKPDDNAPPVEEKNVDPVNKLLQKGLKKLF